MTREQVKELLPIMQAFAEGKEVEIKTKEGSEWSILEEDDMEYIDFKKCDLRIKPKYRPFANREEAWPEMLKHQPFGWIKEAGDKYNIVFIGRNGIIVNNGVGNGYRNFKDAFNLTFDDDTPFGIKE